jgi:hypothetical protein
MEEHSKIIIYSGHLKYCFLARCLFFIWLFGLASSSFSYGLTPLEEFYQLQKLKINVRNAYAYSLIIDHDLRSRDEMQVNLNHVSRLTRQIIDSKLLEEQAALELVESIEKFSHSSKMPTIQYFQSSGTGTASKGYLIYTNLMEKINLAMKVHVATRSIPLSTIRAFDTIDIMMSSIEMHAERALASSRSELFTKEFITQTCNAVNRELSELIKTGSDLKARVKIKRHWQFIEESVCTPLNARAPFSIVFFGSLMIKGLEDTFSFDLASEAQLIVNE